MHNASTSMLPAAAGQTDGAQLYKCQQPEAYISHPAVLDAATHTAPAVSGSLSSDINARRTRIPVGVHAFVALNRRSSGIKHHSLQQWCRGVVNGFDTSGTALASFTAGCSGSGVIVISGLQAREARRAAAAAAIYTADNGRLVYEVQWQVASQHRMSPLSRRQATTRENHAGAWSVVHDGHVGSMCSAPDSALHCFAAGIRNAAGVTGVVTNGLELLQQRLAGSCTLQIVASAGTVPSLTGAGSAMPAAASASLEALAKVAAAEVGSDVLCSGRVDCAAPAAATVPAVDPFGTAAVGGSLLQAKLLRHPLRVLPANSHLLPVPRGSLANLKLEMHASEIPAPGTVKVRAADGVCYMPSTWANSTGLLLSCLPLLTTHCSCVCARWVSTSVMC